MSEEDDVRELFGAIETGDEDTLRELLAEEVDVIGEEETYSQDLLIESMLDLNDALEEMEYTVRDLWQDEGTYIPHVALEGTFANPYRFRLEADGERRSVEPTDETVAGSAVHLLRFDEDGRVAGVGSYGYTDVLHEMGAIEYVGEEAAAAETEA